MARRVRKIRERIDAIADERKKFHFVERVPIPSEIKTISRETGPHILETQVIGRDKDRYNLIKVLLDANIAEENVSVISLVGMGGLGKTALAQIIYNHADIQNYFEFTKWLCISENFDVKKIASEVGDCSIDRGTEEVERCLKDKIAGKRYLIVLDDVWNHDRELWLRLRSLLMDGGTKGSKIIVTTREEWVGKIMDSCFSLTLEGLDKGKSWELFSQLAFKNGKVPDDSEWVNVGEKIVEKCGGVPLAIRTIASVLYGKDSKEEWLNFENIEMRNIVKLEGQNNKILEVLKISYDHLPSHLKICFSYCSLFPKGFEINKKTLIQLWIAQGFIRSCDQEGRRLEDLGHSYFMDLLRRTLFQDIKEDTYGDIRACKMHDLIRELAISVSLEVFGDKVQSVSKKSRTLLSILPTGSHLESVDKNVNKAFASRFKCLRALELPFSPIGTLPDCIGFLRHLRYLDISKREEIEMLPSSITQLVNLQTLKLNGCEKLEELPRDFWKLRKLRHLELEECRSLTHLPPGIGRLTCLQTLTVFPLNHGSSIYELSSLNDLRGELLIKGLDALRCNPSDAKNARLHEKQHLRSLKLHWSGIIVNANDGGPDDIILESLQPPSRIEIIEVDGFNGTRFPNWLSTLSNLVSLEIYHCPYLQKLPPLHPLIHLQYLRLSFLDSLEYIDNNENYDMGKGRGDVGTGISTEELSCSSSSSGLQLSFFPNLERLELYTLPKLKGWWRGLGTNTMTEQQQQEQPHPHQCFILPSFPPHSDVRIIQCPELRQISNFPLCPYPSRLANWNEDHIIANSSWRSTSSNSPRFSSSVSRHIKIQGGIEGYFE